jgi:hypothetical protein
MISALERLRALRAGRPLDGDIVSPESLAMEWRIEYEERAAILEYDGGLSREDADKQALEEILERLRRGRQDEPQS